MKKIYIKAHGCELRILDAKKICRYLSLNNFEIVHNPQNADLIILLTCGALEKQVEASLKLAKDLQRYDAELIVAGCLPDIEKEGLAKIFNGRTISTKNLDGIDDFFPENKIKFKDIDDANTNYDDFNEKNPVEFLKFLLRKIPFIEKNYLLTKDAILSIFLNKDSAVYKFLTKDQFRIRNSWGCPGNCSYCAIKNAIGPYKSKPLADCIEEFEMGLKQGYKNFVVTADDTGPYGIDIGRSLPELLDELTKYEGEYEVLLRGISPKWFVQYANDFEKILKTGKFGGIGVPLQSGNVRILKLMRRYWDIKKISQTFLQLRKNYPSLSVYTDIIIGFPTETWDEFMDTLNLIKEVDVNVGSLYTFSCMKGTEAERIEPKVSVKEISRRVKYAKKFLRKSGYKVIYRRYGRSYYFFKNK